MIHIVHRPLALAKGAQEANSDGLKCLQNGPNRK